MVQFDPPHRVQPGTVGVPTLTARDHFDHQKIVAPSAQQCPCGIFSLRGCSEAGTQTFDQLCLPGRGCIGVEGSSQIVFRKSAASTKDADTA